MLLPGDPVARARHEAFERLDVDRHLRAVLRRGCRQRGCVSGLAAHEDIDDALGGVVLALATAREWLAPLHVDPRVQVAAEPLEVVEDRDTVIHDAGRYEVLSGTLTVE